MIRALVVDDELKSRKMLCALLEKYCLGVEVVGTAESVKSAVSFLKNNSIDLLFLDIEMQSGTGFDVLEQIKETSFEIIFVTAYAEFAVRAFKYFALDYILKPVDFRELVKAVQKAEERTSNQESVESVKLLLESMQSGMIDQQIALATREGLEFVKLSNIIACEATGNYTNFYLKDGTKQLVSKNLKEYENLLPKENFLRVHHSFVINLKEISKYVKGEGGYVIMTNEMMVDIAKSKKKDFLSKIVKL